ncbi:MAG TPA: lysyl oxidase family protein, partial [Candidatus Dormibacteraeota bacterium]|nr:lysyl oxidase family protein [Candidatus Dormibacteraeota bacterium]
MLTRTACTFSTQLGFIPVSAGPDITTQPPTLLGRFCLAIVLLWTLSSQSASFTNGTSISIPLVGAANPYPSSINVTGMTGAVSKVTVQLNALSHTYPDDIDILLVGPAGQKVVIMSDAGGALAINNVTLTVDDAAAASLPDSSQIVSGTFKPTDYVPGDAFSSPAPSGPVSAQLAAFNGTSANGTWSLYIVDDEPNDQGSLAGGWSLSITTLASSNTPPIISAVPNQTTAFNTPTPAIPFTIGDAETPASNLVLAAQSSNQALLPNANISFGGSGSNPTVTLTPATGQSGSANITLSVTDAGGLSASNTFVLVVNGAAQTNTLTFANPSSITIPDRGAATPYPSTIIVSGLTGVVGRVTLQLNQASHTYPDDIDILLVGPGGQKVIIMSDAGGAADIVNVNLTFDDSAAAGLPDSTQIISGVFKPTNFGSTTDTFPAPAPAAPYSGQLSAVSGISPNGTWSLYVVDDGANDQGSIAAGWSLTFTLTNAVSPPTNTPPAISSISAQSIALNTATPPLPFTISDLETPATSLVVTGASSNILLVPNSNIVFGSSGSNRTVTVTPATGQTGSSTITLTVVDTGGLSATSSFLLTATNTIVQTNTASFANSTLITIPDSGTATPYPSAISVSGLTGSVSKVTVQLNQISHTYPDDIDILLVGPGGQKVIIMSDVGGALGVNNVTLVLDDAAATSLPDSGQIVSGTFKPTNVDTADSFPGPAAPYATTLSTFNGTAPNGIWALYVVDDGPNDQGSIAGGWSLTLTTVPAPPAPPANDSFSTAQAITGSSGNISGNTSTATKQSGEPNHAGNAGSASVWFNWTAPSTSPVTFDTTLSSFDTLLAVYTGNNVSSLTTIASNNDIATNNSRSRLTFTPVSGTVYRIAVDGNNGAKGPFTLRWAQASVALPDLSIVGSAVNPRITTESFAANTCAVMEGLIQAGTRRLIRFDTETENQGNADLFFGNPASNPLFVWAPCHAHYHFQNYMSYRLRDAQGRLAAVGLKVGFCILDVFRWNPNSSGAAKYTCSNQGIQTGWGDLYDSTLDGQWIDITGLPDGNYTMELEANPLGIIQESNYGNNVTTVPISIGNPTAPPLNNNFASAQTLLGGFSSVLGNNTNATKETGEPNHAGNPGGHSIWYQWTALDTKPVTIDTIGSSFNTLLAIYTGSSLTALSPVASNDDLSASNSQSRVVFPATAGTVYKIAV